MAIEFGVIDHLDRQNVPVHETYDSRLGLIELYDRAGFYTFHITEHHFTPLGLASSCRSIIRSGSPRKSACSTT